MQEKAFTLEFVSLPVEGLGVEFAFVPWDSELLGAAVGELRLGTLAGDRELTATAAALREALAERAVRLCVARIPTGEPRLQALLQLAGFFYIETALQFTTRLSRHTGPPPAGMTVTVGTLADEELLSEEAATAFHHARFSPDLRLPPDLGSRRYERWLVDALRSEWKSVYLCKLGTTLAGFVVWSRRSRKEGAEALREARFELGSVTPPFQRGIMAPRVLESFLRASREEGFNRVTTQACSNNLGVLRLWIGLGAQVREAHAVFHWMPEGYSFR